MYWLIRDWKSDGLTNDLKEMIKTKMGSLSRKCVSPQELPNPCFESNHKFFRLPSNQLITNQMTSNKMWFEIRIEYKRCENILKIKVNNFRQIVSQIITQYIIKSNVYYVYYCLQLFTIYSMYDLMYDFILWNIVPFLLSSQTILQFMHWNSETNRAPHNPTNPIN